MSDTKDFRAMTAETIGKDLLSALIDELRLLPKPWIQLPQDKQNDVIDRLRKRVETNVGMAVHIISELMMSDAGLLIFFIVAYGIE